MNQKQNMITGSPAKSLLMFALPLILGNLFQQFYSLADSVIVGRTLGQDPLAAVGSVTTICLVYVSIANGLAIGSSVVISQLFGSNNITRMKTAFNTSFVTFIGFTVLALAIAFSTGNAIISLTNIPVSIVPDAKSYYYIYVLGFPGLFFYNIANSGFNALGKSRMPLLFLVFSSVLNIGLDFWFILGLKWGVAGAAIATIVSQYLAAILSFTLLLRYLKKNFKTEDKAQLFDPKMLKTIAKVAVPSMVTTSVVSVGFVAVQSLVNSFDTDVMAGFVAACKIDGIAIIPMVQVGSAVSTFAAQNIGAGKADRVPKGYHMALWMNLVIAVVFAAVLLLFGRNLVGMFMEADTSGEAIRIGNEYLSIVGCFYVLMGLMNITGGVLRGAGDATFSMISVLVNFGSRIAFAYIAVALGGDQNMIWWSNIIGWSIGFIVSFVRYKSGSWRKKSLV